MRDVEAESGDNEVIMCRNCSQFVKKKMSGPSLTQSNAARNAANNQRSSPFVVEDGDSEAEEEVLFPIRVITIP